MTPRFKRLGTLEQRTNARITADLERMTDEELEAIAGEMGEPFAARVMAQLRTMTNADLEQLIVSGVAPARFDALSSAPTAPPRPASVGGRGVA